MYGPFLMRTNIAVSTAISSTLPSGINKNAHTSKPLKTRKHLMYNTSTSTSLHIGHDQVPQVTIDTHYIPNENDVTDDKLSFHVFKITTSGSEINYFFKSDEQLNEFIGNLRSLMNQRARISGSNL